MKYHRQIFTVMLFLFPSLSVFAQAALTAAEYAERANRLYNVDGKPAEALVEIEKAIVIDPQNGNFYVLRANYREPTETSTILADAESAARLSPTDRGVLYAAAQVLKQARLLKEALTMSDQLIALGSVDRFGWSMRIHLKLQTQDYGGAWEDNTEALRLFPGENMFRQTEAIIARLMGDTDKALPIYDAVIASLEKKLASNKMVSERPDLARDLVNFLFSRAGHFFDAGNAATAQKDLRRAVEVLPDGWVYAQRSRIYRESGFYNLALADIASALRLNPPDAFSLVSDRGIIFVETGRCTEAETEFRSLLKLEPKMTDYVAERLAWAKRTCS